MKKIIRIANIMKGRTDAKGNRVLIPFNTGKSEFDPIWKYIPRHVSLVFQIDRKGEFVFSGVNITCPCLNCVKRRKRYKK